MNQQPPDMTIELVLAPTTLAPLCKDVKEVFVAWMQCKDDSRIGFLASTPATPAWWLSGQAKLNSQRPGAGDTSKLSEKENFANELTRHKLWATLYLQFADQKLTLEEQHVALAHWADTNRIHLVRTKGGKA